MLQRLLLAEEVEASGTHPEGCERAFGASLGRQTLAEQKVYQGTGVSH